MWRWRTAWIRRVYAGLAVSSILIAMAGAAALASAYSSYATFTERTLADGPLANTSDIYAAPEVLKSGYRLSRQELIEHLRLAGYAQSAWAAPGSFHVRGNRVEIHPGTDAAVAQPVRVEFSGDRISTIKTLVTKSELESFTLDPKLIANVSARNRELRRPARFDQLPEMLVKAVLAAEDKHFFQHRGLDLKRIAKAAYVNLLERRKGQGASTLTMQLARSLWLTSEKSWSRKAAEALIALHLERKLSKEAIFEHYANQVYLGRSSTYSIHGYGAAAQAFFGKELRELTLPEAALLAGLAQRPSYYDPLRHPERAVHRRNLVLAMMRQNGYIGEETYRAAFKEPLKINPVHGGIFEAPYFVDLVNREVSSRFKTQEKAHRLRVDTALDLKLQSAAEAAVQVGMERVDDQLRRQNLIYDGGPRPEIALIAIDPHTGEIKALIGGRNYGASQINRVFALRQPGSVFKPFVYAAALNTALIEGAPLFTPATVITDQQTTFWFNDEPYEPSNFSGSFSGEVTLRRALANSINVVTVELAQIIGFRTVAEIAHKAGLTNLGATPSISLGAYDATPLEIAGAYTIFASNGRYIQPTAVRQVKAYYGSAPVKNKVAIRAALDPRVAFLTVSLLEEVVNSGTGARVRSEGIQVPVAGKTGTSRDGWFAGFTSNLLCLVWVGFDDGTDLQLEGARSALIVWSEFMKRALRLPAYRNSKGFRVPEGIVSVAIDSETGRRVSPFCPNSRLEYFIAGTEPVDICSTHSHAPPAPGQTAEFVVRLNPASAKE